jgi:hypothetical protein
MPVADVAGVYMVQQVGGYNLPAGLGTSYPLAWGKLVLHADGTYTDSLLIRNNVEWSRDTLYLADPLRRNHQGNVADQFTYLKVQ